MSRHRLSMLLGAAVLVLGAMFAFVSALAQGGAPQASGEVTKIDKAHSRLEIRHGGIKALDMPPMRMSFRVREPKVLDGLVVGDKVLFTAEKIDGSFTATSIRKEP